MSLICWHVLCRYMKYIVFGLYSFWIPQIVLCVRDDVRQPLKPMYVIGMSLTRLALPLYLFGCPHNLPRVPFSPAICIGLTLHLAFQVFLPAGDRLFLLLLDVRVSKSYVGCSAALHAHSSCLPAV